MNYGEVKMLLDRIDAPYLFGVRFNINLKYDKKYSHTVIVGRKQEMATIGRVYIQISYKAECNKSGEREVWYGRKWYLSDHMTKDEVVKTAFLAFKQAVEHEVMESFKVDGKILFNPHVSFESLLKISDEEIRRGPRT